MGILKLAVSSAFVLLACGFCRSEPPQAEIQSTPASVIKTVVIEKGDAHTSVRKEVDLGLFRPGTVINLSLKVVNKSTKPFGFDRLEAGCKCLEVSPHASKLEPGESVEFNVKLKSPMKSNRAVQTATFWVSNRAVRRFVISMEYAGAGVVGFPNSAVRVGVPTGSADKNVEIPFFADALSTPEMIDVTLSSKLAALAYSINHEDKKVILAIPPRSLDNGRLAGQMIIRNIETLSSDQITIDISRNRPSEVFPSVLRFSPFVTEESTPDKSSTLRRYAANVVVHCKSLPEDATVETEFTVGGFPLSVISHRRPRNVMFYKVALASQSAIEAAMKEGASVECRVVFGKIQDRQKLPIVFVSK
jgi:hypothetical protein